VKILQKVFFWGGATFLTHTVYDIYRRQSTDQQLINYFYVIGHEISYRIRRNNAKWWLLRRSRSFKVTHFGTSSKAHIRLPIGD